MKQRIRFGIKLSLPFGIFKNAATFVLHVSAAQLQTLQTNVENIQSVLILAGQAEIASRLFVEVS